MTNIAKDFYQGAGAQAAAATSTFDNRQPAKDLLLVKIYTPFRTYFEGDARSLSALNESGTFDILPGHHNFITMLLPCDVEVSTPTTGKQSVHILRGLLHVRSDKVTIFLDV